MDKSYVVFTSGDGSFQSAVVKGLENARRKFVEHMWFGSYEDGCKNEMISSYLKEFDDQENNWCMGVWHWDGEQCSGFIAEITEEQPRITALEALAKQMVDALEDCHKLIDKKVKCDTKVFGFYREHDPSQCAACISFNKSKEALGAYKRVING